MIDLINTKNQKESISMILDSFMDAETYRTALYLHKSHIVLPPSPRIHTLIVDLQKDTKLDKLANAVLTKPYGTYITTFLNADFSNAENAYNTFFVYYGIEGFLAENAIKEGFSKEHANRYKSTKKFLEYYTLAFECIQNEYVTCQKDMKKTIDFTYNLHGKKGCPDIDKYSKFCAFSASVDLISHSFANLEISIYNNSNPDESPKKTLKQIEQLAYDIANKEKDTGIHYIYKSKSHLALAFVALNDFVKNSKKSINICQNCGRYYVQNSGKEVYCELPNLDGKPSCKSYASRKAYDNKIVEDIAELTYKREYQRRITQVYRADENHKKQIKDEYLAWKKEAREQLKLYRANKISKEELCEWIEKNK